VNRPVVRLFAVLLVLFALLVWKTSQWAVFDASALQDNPQNRRSLILSQTVPRGTIKTADGVTVAESSPENGGNTPIYVRHYPQGALFGNPVGYSFVEVGQSGIERSENDALTGERNEFTSIIDQLRGVAQSGDDVTLTIDAHAQQVATQALEQAQGVAGSNGAGAVVAIDPSTGAIKAMASIPGYDPNSIRDTATFHQLNTESDAPLFNRATQSGYPPGSAMKVVTATAALDSGEFTPSTVLSGRSPQIIGGAPLFNAGNEQFGNIDMTTALTNSVNTYFAQVGERLGADTMFEYMDRFGFNQDPQLDYPDSQMRASGVYAANGSLYGPNGPIDIGRVAIGQGSLLVTPLQMAEVAATVANHGVLMRPTFVQEITDPDGRTVQELDPREQSTVMSPETASTLTDMMTKVTQEGTAAGLTVDGTTFAGKTGTAEIDPQAGINQPWFIAFAPATDPQVAVAATIERCTHCFGADVAGPVATQVMESLLGG
jgi:penicillin-binding protein A